MERVGIEVFKDETHYTLEYWMNTMVAGMDECLDEMTDCTRIPLIARFLSQYADVYSSNT